jgi:hypothetical protein
MLTLGLPQGALPGWWLGSEDGRADEPYVDPERWALELSKAGFSVPDAVVPDYAPPFQNEAVIIASPAVETTTTSTVSLLSSQPDGPVARGISAALQKRGMSVDIATLSNVPKQGIISILDLEGRAFLNDIAPKEYASLRDFLVNIGTDNGILWLTKSCQMECASPSYGAIIGLTRVLRNEQKINISTLEMDEFTSEEAMTTIYNVFQRNRNQITVSDDDVHPDSEYSWARGSLYIPRLRWVSVSDELTERPSGSSATMKKLEVGKKGSLKTLEWRDVPAVSRPEPGEVLVETRAVGMNFKVSSIPSKQKPLLPLSGS